ncbi:testis-expressed protein 10 homolog [Antedon mediterranea]|uniref:testis-expressed protein 10 homolog n=1 Tax=Antedon mediterranea TaxID=105859 RepID=UPI003AF4CCBE
MGKSGRKSKEKKKDFQKVKLKVGKSKPAANNVTKATFKTGGVLIREQLKQDESQPTTQRKQNIHELLCQLNHYNSKVRQDSLWGMKELLTKHPELISEHLALLVDNFCTLFTDKQASVRKATISLLALLFANTHENDMSPFMSILVVYLCSAMTHIDESVQLDSLSVLDLCLDSYPNLIVPHSQELLMNFVSQITRQRSMKPDFENADLELIVNPDRKMTSQSWRLKVLARLRKFLQSLLETRKVDVSAVDTSGVTAIRWDETNGNNLHFKPFLLEGFTLRSLTSDTNSQTNQLSSVGDVVSFVNKVIPLLMQSWMEVSPSLMSTESGLLPVAMETLEAVLGVLCLLLKWVRVTCMEKDDFKPLDKLLAQHKKEFSQRLFTSFPLIENSHGSNKRKKGKQSGVQTSNLALAEIMTYFINKDKPLKGWYQRLHDHFVDDLSDYCTVDHVTAVLSIVKRLIGVLNKSDANTLLEVLCDLHKKFHQKSQVRGFLLRFLSDIAMKESGFESVNEWVSSLPTEVLRLNIGKSCDRSNVKSCDISDIIQVISKAASRGHQTVLQGFQDNIVKLMDHRDGLLLQVSALEQRELVQLLYWVPILGKDLLRELAFASMDERLTCDNIAFAFQLLTIRFSSCETHEIDELLSCLLTSNLGLTMEVLNNLELEASGKEKNDDVLLIRPPTYCYIVLQSCDSKDYFRQTRICKIICDCFKQLEISGRVWISYQLAVYNLLSSKRIFPIKSLQSILRTFYHLNSENTQIGTNLSQHLAHCCLASILASVPLYEAVYNDDHWSIDLWTLCVDIFLKTPDLLHLSLELMDCGIQDVSQEDDIYKTAIVLLRLLQTSSLSIYLVRDALLLRRISNNLQIHHLCPKESQWRVELNYELSLLPSVTDRR